MTALPDYAEALATVLAAVEALGQTETVQPNAASGRVLAETIDADSGQVDG